MMNYSIKVNRNSQEEFDNIVVWLDDNHHPSTPNDIKNPTPTYLTYAAICYKQAVLENLKLVNGNVQRLCEEMVAEFSEDFEMVTRNINAASNPETGEQMLQIVSSFICEYIHSLNEQVA